MSIMTNIKTLKTCLIIRLLIPQFVGEVCENAKLYLRSRINRVI